MAYDDEQEAIILISQKPHAYRTLVEVPGRDLDTALEGDFVVMVFDNAYEGELGTSDASGLLAEEEGAAYWDGRMIDVSGPAMELDGVVAEAIFEIGEVCR